MKRIGIFGASGMAREAGDVAWAAGYVPFYVAKDAREQMSSRFGDEVILESQVERYQDVPFVIGIGDNAVRAKVAERFAGKLRFGNLIHPQASFGREQLEQVVQCNGVIVCAGARLTSGIEVGNFNILNQNVTIAHDCVLGAYVHVAPGANVSGNVTLEEGSWVGAGAVINQGTSEERLVIGQGTMIGSGAVVTRSCVSHAVYAGVPAKRVK